jgi:hypothetical protein
MNLFLATGLTSGDQNLMDDERIEIAWYPPKQVRDMIHSGKIIDAKTIVAYYLWLDWRKTSKAA